MLLRDPPRTVRANANGDDMTDDASESGSADAARSALASMIDLHGPALLHEPDRLKRQLDAALPDARRDVELILASLTAEVPHALLAAHSDGQLRALFPQLVDRLVRGTGVERAAATWAVRTWAHALAVAVGGADAGRPDGDRRAADRDAFDDGPHAGDAQHERRLREDRDAARRASTAEVLGFGARPIRHKAPSTVRPPSPIESPPTAPAAETLVAFDANRERAADDASTASPPVAAVAERPAPEPVRPWSTAPRDDAPRALAADAGPIEPVTAAHERDAPVHAAFVAPALVDPAIAEPRAPTDFGPAPTRTAAESATSSTTAAVPATPGTAAPLIGTSPVERDQPASPTPAATAATAVPPAPAESVAPARVARPVIQPPASSAIEPGPRRPAAVSPVADDAARRPPTPSSEPDELPPTLAVPPRRASSTRTVALSAAIVAVVIVIGATLWPAPKSAPGPVPGSGAVATRDSGPSAPAPAAPVDKPAEPIAPTQTAAQTTPPASGTPRAREPAPTAVDDVAHPSPGAASTTGAAADAAPKEPASAAAGASPIAAPALPIARAASRPSRTEAAVPKPRAVAQKSAAADAASRRVTVAAAVPKPAPAEPRKPTGATCTRSTCGSVVSVRAIDDAATRDYEVIVRLDDRSIRAVRMPARWSLGARVRVAGNRFEPVGER